VQCHHGFRPPLVLNLESRSRRFSRLPIEDFLLGGFGTTLCRKSVSCITLRLAAMLRPRTLSPCGTASHDSSNHERWSSPTPQEAWALGPSQSSHLILSSDYGWLFSHSPPNLRRKCRCFHGSHAQLHPLGPTLFVRNRYLF